MMTTMICTVCSEPKVVTSRSVVLPFVCDECQKAEELYNAMAPTPASVSAYYGKLFIESVARTGRVIPTTHIDSELEAAVKNAGQSLGKSDACDSATIENTTLLIEDQANQLALAKNEVEGLRAIVQFLEAREIALTAQVEAKQEQVENLLVKGFFKDEKISVLAKQAETLGIAGFQRAMKTLYVC